VHRSKVTAVLADVPDECFADEVAFWSGALGRPPVIDDADPDYAELGLPLPGLQFMVQRIGGPARLHLDVETDDIDAEVARLETLGARRVAQVQSWWVLRDPAGLLFCVVRVQPSTDFDALATTWG
jgi:Glyoxalase-like domain